MREIQSTSSLTSTAVFRYGFGYARQVPWHRNKRKELCKKNVYFQIFIPEE